MTLADVEEPGPGAHERHGLVEARHDRTEVTEADRDALRERVRGKVIQADLQGM